MSQQDNYLEALNILLDIEGGSTDYTWDSGGATHYGIARNYWPQYWTDGPPTYETAKRFYRVEFWEPLHLGILEYQPLRVEVLEAAVNSGKIMGSKFVQDAYNLIRPIRWPALVVDGKIGSKTIAAINRMTRKYPDALMAACNYFQAHYYVTMNGPARAKALRGWFAKRLHWERRQ